MKVFIICLVLIVLGVIGLVNPRFMYTWTEGWKHAGDEDEPSELYLWGNRIVGVIAILAGIYGLIVLFLS